MMSWLCSGAQREHAHVESAPAHAIVQATRGERLATFEVSGVFLAFLMRL